METQVIHVRMPCELVERLDEYAKRTHRNRPGSVIHALELLLAAPDDSPKVKRIVGRRLVEEPLEDARVARSEPPTNRPSKKTARTPHPAAQAAAGHRERSEVEPRFKSSTDSSTTRRTR